MPSQNLSSGRCYILDRHRGTEKVSRFVEFFRARFRLTDVNALKFVLLGGLVSGSWGVSTEPVPWVQLTRPGASPSTWPPSRLTNIVFAATNKPAIRLPQSGAAQVPAPGVYKTEPFSCIVLVPGAMDTGIFGNRNGFGNIMGQMDKMPHVTPELRFIPRTPPGVSSNLLMKPTPRQAPKRPEK
jgi:hypothetical protein